MPPILGNAIALLFVGVLVCVCARTLWLDHKRGGGCASRGGTCGGDCAGCAGCSVGTGSDTGTGSGRGARPGGKIAYNGKIYHVDADAPRVKTAGLDGKM